MFNKILIIEDNKSIQKLLQLNLTEANYKVIQAFDGEEGVSKANELKPDLIILDINLPKLNGIAVCKELKSKSATRDIPIIMLTVRKDEIDRVLGFEIGADDYVTKPFSPRELVLRVKVVLHRKEEQTKKPKVITVGEISLDESTFEVSVAGKPVSLTAREFKLLQYFLLNKERLLSRQKILDNVWGYLNSADLDTRTVDAHIKSLRKKLPTKKAKIITLIGMGYKLTTHV